MKRAELKTRLLRTKRPNLAGEGIFSKREQFNCDDTSGTLGALRPGRRGDRSEAVVLLGLDIADRRCLPTFELYSNKNLRVTLLQCA